MSRVKQINVDQSAPFCVLSMMVHVALIILFRGRVVILRKKGRAMCKNKRSKQMPRIK